MGTDSFTYTVLDSASQTDTANVTVTVSAPPLVLVDDVCDDVGECAGHGGCSFE